MVSLGKNSQNSEGPQPGWWRAFWIRTFPNACPCCFWRRQTVCWESDCAVKPDRRDGAARRRRTQSICRKGASRFYIRRRRKKRNWERLSNSVRPFRDRLEFCHKKTGPKARSFWVSNACRNTQALRRSLTGW